LQLTFPWSVFFYRLGQWPSYPEAVSNALRKRHSSWLVGYQVLLNAGYFIAQRQPTLL
jgi:hypothetical protein